MPDVLTKPHWEGAGIMAIILASSNLLHGGVAYIILVHPVCLRNLWFLKEIPCVNMIDLNNSPYYKLKLIFPFEGKELGGSRGIQEFLHQGFINQGIGLDCSQHDELTVNYYKLNMKTFIWMPS
jgi:hypothetical protein